MLDFLTAGVSRRAALATGLVGAISSSIPVQAGAAPSALRGFRDDDPTGVWSFAKGLPQDAQGVVDPKAYRALVDALRKRDFAALAAVPFAGTSATALVCPSVSFDLPITRTLRSSHFTLPTPPKAQGEEAAAEMVELYWAALIRDVPFDEYATSDLVQAACVELSALTKYRGPRDESGQVTPDLLLRSAFAVPPDRPISALLLRDIPAGALSSPATVEVAETARDWLTDVAQWRTAQSGKPALSPAGPTKRVLIGNGRHLAQYVFRDPPFQAFINAAFILDAAKTPYTPGLPYAAGGNQRGFVAYGLPHLLTLLARVTDAALRASWYHKWVRHRKLRPEELAGRVHAQLTNAANFDLPRTVIESEAVSRTVGRYGTALLTQAYPLGGPGHPAYPAGHAAIAGACAAVLKAWYAAPITMTVGATSRLVADEVDILAGNIAQGRSYAGVHYRSDNEAGLRLGERVGRAILAEDRRDLPEPCPPYQIRCFDGTVRQA
ncbi:MAG: hypothetical protein ACRCTR_06380 [Actinomycetota bacterium]